MVINNALTVAFTFLFISIHIAEVHSVNYFLLELLVLTLFSYLHKIHK